MTYRRTLQREKMEGGILRDSYSGVMGE